MKYILVFGLMVLSSCQLNSFQRSQLFNGCEGTGCLQWYSDFKDFGAYLKDKHPEYIIQNQENISPKVSLEQAKLFLEFYYLQKYKIQKNYSNVLFQYAQTINYYKNKKDNPTIIKQFVKDYNNVLVCLQMMRDYYNIDFVEHALNMRRIELFIFTTPKERFQIYETLLKIKGINEITANKFTRSVLLQDKCSFPIKDHDKIVRAFGLGNGKDELIDIQDEIKNFELIHGTTYRTKYEKLLLDSTLKYLNQ